MSTAANGGKIGPAPVLPEFSKQIIFRDLNVEFVRVH